MEGDWSLDQIRTPLIFIGVGFVVVYQLFLKKEAFFKNKSSFNSDNKLVQEFRESARKSGGKLTKKMEDDL